MNKVLKKVLIYLGVGAIGAVVGIGALIGVSSCAYKQESNTQQKTKAQPRRKKITFGESDLNNDNIYYFVAKNYEDNGKGAFWHGYSASQTIDTANISNAQPFPNVSSESISTSLEFHLSTSDSDTPLTHLHFYLEPYAGSVSVLSQVRLYNQNFSEANTLWYCDSSGAVFIRNNASFYASRLTYASTYNQPFFDMVNSLFTIYKLDNQVYTMAGQINYYMPYSQNIDTGLVFDNSVLTSDWVKRYTLIDNRPFYCNGLVFDTIKLVYRNAYNKVFVIYEDVKKLITDSTGIAYFSEMVYENSVTGYSVVVNNRQYVSDTNNDNLVMVYQRSSNWVSTSYRVLKFFDLYQSDLDALSHLNDLSYGSTYIADSSEAIDAGLGATFNLISSAFTAWVPIFSIQVVPGITIGLLLFLPLIAGVIILIIWVVKR